jgi:hypothetical protein
MLTPQNIFVALLVVQVLRQQQGYLGRRAFSPKT